MNRPTATIDPTGNFGVGFAGALPSFGGALGSLGALGTHRWRGGRRRYHCCADKQSDEAPTLRDPIEVVRAILMVLQAIAQQSEVSTYFYRFFVLVSAAYRTIAELREAERRQAGRGRKRPKDESQGAADDRQVYPTALEALEAAAEDIYAQGGDFRTPGTPVDRDAPTNRGEYFTQVRRGEGGVSWV